MTAELECWSCGRTLEDVLKPFSRDVVCPACESDLHVCRMCEFYAPSAAKSCREPVAEEVRDKTRANFCDYFRPRPGAHARDDAAEAARGELESLFGLDSQREPSPSPPDASERERERKQQAAAASDELKRLFGLDDTGQ